MHRPSLRSAGVVAASVTLLTAVGSAAFLSPVSAAPAKAPSIYKAKLSELNNSGARGVATIQVRGNQLTVIISGEGFTPNMPHLQHIHGAAKAANECPTIAADESGDGLVDVLEGAEYYGPVDATLSTSGPTDTLSAAIDVSVAPYADAEGDISYRRTITVNPLTAQNLTDFHIVQHGVDIDGTGSLLDNPRISDLGVALGLQIPLEAALPATCGQIEKAGHQH